MKKQIIIGTLLFLISLAGTATAQTISGKVTDAEAHPIDGATVILQSIDSTFVDALITDSTGCFRFNRQPAQYRLIFQHILYTYLCCIKIKTDRREEDTIKEKALEASPRNGLSPPSCKAPIEYQGCEPI